MDRRITIALLVVLAALGGYVWYMFLRADAPPVTPVTPAPTPLALLKFDDTTLIALQVQDVKNNRTTRVVRSGDGWNMEQPAQGEAFRPRVERVIYDLSLLNAERKIESPGDLSAFGLEPPAYRVQMNFQDGSTRTLVLGNQNPDGNYSYVMLDADAALYLINASAGEEIEQFTTMPPFTPTPSPTEPPFTPTP